MRSDVPRAIHRKKPTRNTAATITPTNLPAAGLLARRCRARLLRGGGGGITVFAAKAARWLGKGGGTHGGSGGWPAANWAGERTAAIGMPASVAPDNSTC